jgi:hypothetical protein
MAPYCIEAKMYRWIDIGFDLIGFDKNICFDPNFYYFRAKCEKIETNQLEFNFQ